MRSILLAAVVLTSIQSSEDGSRLVLSFDGPISFIQSAAASPPSIVVDVAGASPAPGLLAGLSPSGPLRVQQVLEPPGLRLIVPLPPGASGRASASGARLTIEMSIPPAARTPAAPGAGAAADGEGETTARVEPTGEPLIGPEDLLEINVFELPELKTTTRVLDDGTISLPLLGVVQAAGLTKTALEVRVRDLLEARFVQDPQVTIGVTEHRSRQVSVIGAVTKPGPIQMIGPRTVLQMISEAGGLTKEAGTEIFVIRRTESGRAERIQLDLEELITKGNPDLNLLLSPGDVINVPVDRPIYVYVDGAVRNPGQVEGRSSRAITLLQAVARAGGLTERANLRDVHVLRKTAGGQSRIPVNLRQIRKGKADDLVLVDGDVVVVPETFF